MFKAFFLPVFKYHMIGACVPLKVFIGGVLQTNTHL